MNRTLCVAMVVLALTLVICPAPADDSEVKTRDGARPKELMKDPETNTPMLVWLAYEGYEPHVEPERDSKKRAGLGLKFMQSFRVAATDNKEKFHLLVTSEDGEKVDQLVGWVPGRYLVLKNQALKDETTRITKKALVVNTLKTLKSLGSNLDEVKIRAAPYGKARDKDEPHRLYTTLFVYGEADGYVLVGDDPSFNPHKEENAAKAVLGWLPADRIAIWNTREAVEWDHEATLEPGHRPNYLINDPRKKPPQPRRTQPGRIYKTIEDARKGVEDQTLKGDFEETFEKDEKWPYEVSPRLDHEVPRFPVLQTVKDIQDLKAGQLLQVGAIGALCDANGKPILTAAKVKELKEVLAFLGNQGAQTDILFVVDDTESMEDWFKIVAGHVRAITNLAKEDRRQVRIAVSYYNDTQGAKAGEKRSPVLASPLKEATKSGEEMEKDVAAHGPKDGGDALEMLYRGLVESIDAANFRPQARKMVILLGDSGDISADPARMKADPTYATKYNIDAIVNLLVPKNLDREAPIEFYPIQVIDPIRNEAAKCFYDQTKAIVAKYNEVLLARKKAQLGKNFDAQLVQKAEYFGPTEPIGTDYKAVLKERYTRLVAEGKVWEEVFNKLKKGQWRKTKLTKDMEQRINKQLEDITAKDGQPVTLKMLQDSGGVQLFEQGFVWEKTRDGLPLIRKRVLVTGGELKELVDLLGDLDTRTKSKPPSINDLLASVIDKQIGEKMDAERLSTISLNTIYKQWTGLAFRSSLLGATHGKMKKERALLAGEHFALMHVRDQLLDISNFRRRKYEVLTHKLAGQIVYEFTGQSAGQEKEVRWFHIGNDTALKWYYLDYDSEWP